MRSRFKRILQTGLKVFLLGYVIVNPHHLSSSDTSTATKTLSMSFDQEGCTYLHTIPTRDDLPNDLSIDMIDTELSPHKHLINMGNIDGNTPLHYLAWHSKKINLAQWLLNNGASVDCANKFEHRPLLFAIMRANVEMVDLLLKNKADASFIHGDGLTYLHIAIHHLKVASRESLATIERLLKEESLDPRIKNHFGQTAIDYISLRLADDETFTAMLAHIKKIIEEASSRRNLAEHRAAAK